MRAVLPLLLATAPAFADTSGSAVRAPCDAVRGTGDLCAMATRAAAELAASLPVALRMLHVTGATASGPVVTLEARAAGSPRHVPLPVAEFICGHPALARLLQAGGQVHVTRDGRPHMTRYSCEAP